MPLLAIGKPSFQFNQQGGGEGFSIQITGDSTSVLNEISTGILRALSTVPGLKDVRSDAETGDKEVRVIIDRDRAAAAGLTTAEIGMAVSIAMRGENLREFRGEFGEVAVRLAFRDDEKQTVEQLADLPLYKPTGERITLGSVAELASLRIRFAVPIGRHRSCCQAISTRGCRCKKFSPTFAN
jgi:HAE1 family hydrophobic/amphiphilic exporter-1